MAKLHGKFGKVEFSADEAVMPTTATAVLAMHKWGLSIQGQAEEATDFNSGGWSEFLQGNITHTASVEAWWDATEVKLQGTVPNLPQLFGGMKACATFYVDNDGNPTQKYSANYIVTSFDPDCDVKGNVTFKLALQGTGPFLAVPS